MENPHPMIKGLGISNKRPVIRGSVGYKWFHWDMDGKSLGDWPDLTNDPPVAHLTNQVTKSETVNPVGFEPSEPPSPEDPWMTDEEIEDLAKRKCSYETHEYDAVKTAKPVRDKAQAVIGPLRKEVNDLKMLQKEIVNSAKSANDHFASRIRSLEEREKQLEGMVRKLAKQGESLVFTASKLWDDVKPIKDTDCMRVTHPTIEGMNIILTESKTLVP